MPRRGLLHLDDCFDPYVTQASSAHADELDDYAHKLLHSESLTQVYVFYKTCQQRACMPALRSGIRSSLPPPSSCAPTTRRTRSSARWRFCGGVTSPTALWAFATTWPSPAGTLAVPWQTLLSMYRSSFFHARWPDQCRDPEEFRDLLLFFVRPLQYACHVAYLTTPATGRKGCSCVVGACLGYIQAYLEHDKPVCPVRRENYGNARKPPQAFGRVWDSVETFQSFVADIEIMLTAKYDAVVLLNTGSKPLDMRLVCKKNDKPIRTHLIQEDHYGLLMRRNFDDPPTPSRFQARWNRRNIDLGKSMRRRWRSSGAADLATR